MNLKNQIEALLFLTDKPLKTQVIARTINQDVQLVRQAMLELINDYEERQGAIEIADEDGYMMQVKDEFSNLVDEFAPFEMPTSLVRTLSAIAIKQPVLQSEVIKIRGAGAYDHIKELLARELIHRKEDGRSPTLTTTKKFQEYFRLSKDGQTWRTVMDKAQKAQPADHIDMDDEVSEPKQLAVFDATPKQEGAFDASPELKQADGEDGVANESVSMLEAVDAISDFKAGSLASGSN